MKKVLVTISSLAAGIMPGLLFAQKLDDKTLGGLIKWAIAILNTLVPLLIAVSVVWFIWNVFQYAIQGDEDKKKTAKTNIIWGVVALFIMVSVWGLVGILESTFGLGTTGVPQMPQLIPGVKTPSTP